MKRSDLTYSGPERAPNRAYMKAMGLNDDDLKNYMVGVAAAWNEAGPCNIHVLSLANHTKEGIRSMDGTPRVFTTPVVIDGIAMGLSNICGEVFRFSFYKCWLLIIEIFRGVFC